MTGWGKFPKNDPKMAKFGFSANNFGTEGPRDLKFGLLATPGVCLPQTMVGIPRTTVGLPRTRIKNRLFFVPSRKITNTPACPECHLSNPIC